MKIAVINGSPKGRASNTNVMVSAFLKGIQETGAETVDIFLAEKKIEHCKGCHVCWERGPAQCVTSDDMLGILSQLAGANIIAFATPVYFENISGMLKVFMDRMTMIGSPHPHLALKVDEESQKPAPQSPKLMMIANCGHPDRDEFQVISHWIKRVALKMNMEPIGEIYAEQGKYLSKPPKELKPSIDSYLKLLEKAGKEVAMSTRLLPDTAKALERGYL